MFVPSLGDFFRCRGSPRIALLSARNADKDCWARMRTVHQSMNGAPRCGVAIVVNDRGVYSVGLTCVIR